MKGEAVTISFNYNNCFPATEVKEPRLFSENSNQKTPDYSFKEKLEIEKARLGLLFSPFSQLELLFSPQNLNFNTQKIEKDFNACLTSEQPKPNVYEPQNEFRPSSPVHHPSSLQMFESFSPSTFNRQLTRILWETGWLTPNLAAQPLFYQAFLEGKLQPKFDLQALVDQILEQVNLVKEKGKVELSLGLKPENLGEVLLTLTSHSGLISIEIRAQSETKKMMESELEELKKQLKKAKVNFDKIQIVEITSS